MDKFILSSLTATEIKELIRDGLKEALGVTRMEQSPQSASEYLDLNEASKILMRSKNSIYGMTCRQLIPFYKRCKRLYFKREELLNWLGQGRKKTIEEIRQCAESQMIMKGRVY